MIQAKVKGFTLVELIMTVAILAVLAAVAVPIFASTAHKAKQGTDIASATEIANAINLHNNENSENLEAMVTQTEVDKWSTQADVQSKLGGYTPKLAPDNFADAIDRISVNDVGIATVSTVFN